MLKPADLDPHQARAHFNRAAASYDQAAHLQRQIGEWLVAHLEELPSTIQAQTLVDLGTGTGGLLPALTARYPDAHIIAVDWAASMLKRLDAVAQPLCADAAALPLATHSVDVVISNLMLQWSVDYRQVFGECARVLRPGGWLICSTFGPDTLQELRACWATVDDKPHVNDFTDVHHLGDALIGLGFRYPVLDVDRLCLRYDTLKAFMRELKSLGAHNAQRQRRLGLQGKQAFAKLCAAYEALRLSDGLPVSYEIIYAVAQAASPNVPGEVILFLDK